MIEAGVFVLKERERGRRETERELVRESDEEMKDDFQALPLNGESQQLSSSRFSSLLASKDRDYLISSTGAQVLSPPLSLSLSLSPWMFYMGNQMKHILTFGLYIYIYIYIYTSPPLLRFDTSASYCVHTE